MVRNLVLGNGSLLINIDEWLQVRDIYFPQVGQYNHLLGHAHRMAVLTGDHVSWINGHEWERQVGYSNESLVTKSTAKNNKDLAITFNEGVCKTENVFFRKITFENTSKEPLTRKICFHHDFHMYGDGIGDSGFFHPDEKAVIHYKRSTYFLIGVAEGKKSIAIDYDINHDVELLASLKKNPAAQGKVQSAIGVDISLQPQEKKEYTYFFIAGKNLDEVCGGKTTFLKKNVDSHIACCKKEEKHWLSQITPNISILETPLQELYKRSLLIIQTQIDNGGGILAANDSDIMEFNRDTYSYVWPRDASLISIALIRSGFYEEFKRFIYFCRDVVDKKGFLLQKYNPDKTYGSSWHPWVYDDKFSLPIQEDETALVLHSLWVYYSKTKDRAFIEEVYKDLIEPMGKFLAEYRYPNYLPKESHDLWEEKRGIFTFTTSIVLAGLLASEKLGDVVKDIPFCKNCVFVTKKIKDAMVKHLYNDKEKYFRKSIFYDGERIIYDDTIDMSAYALFEFGVFSADDPKVVSTMQRACDILKVKTSVGGYARYYNDYYFRKTDNIAEVPGNPWIICTLWRAKWIIKNAKKSSDLAEAEEIFKWVLSHSLSTGIMPEQLHPYTGAPLSVAPLTWSHAEFIDTINQYIEVVEKMKNEKV